MWGAQGPCLHKQTLGKPEMLNTQTGLFSRRDVYCFPAGEPAGDVVKSLVTSVICSPRPHLIPQNYCVDPDSSYPALDP